MAALHGGLLPENRLGDRRVPKGQFTPHAWVEVYAGDQWTPLEASLEKFTVGHLTQELNLGKAGEGGSSMVNWGMFEIVDIKTAKKIKKSKSKPTPKPQ